MGQSGSYGNPGGGAKGLKAEVDAAIASPPPPGPWGTLLDGAELSGSKSFPQGGSPIPGICRGDERGSEG